MGRFQELKVFCTHVVPDNEKLLKRFIGGLRSCIEGHVTFYNSETLDDAICIAERFMDQVVKHGNVQMGNNFFFFG